MRDSKKTSDIAHIRHTLAHLLAAAVAELYPHAKPTIGPAIEHGFYYDFDFSGGNVPGENDLAAIEAKMRELLPTWTAFTHETVTEAGTKKHFTKNPYKLELVEEIIGRGEPLTLYICGGFTDLCRGGHAEHPAKEISPDSFKLDRIAGAYWRGDEKNAQLTRIYGLAFSTKKELDAHLAMLEEAKKRDHKVLGPQLDLFTFSSLVGPGLPLWTPKGTILRDALDGFVWELRKAEGYERVDIPHLAKKDLYETSGHWDKFKDELFTIRTREGHLFAVKPMNCPHHAQLYARRQWSYRELPQRYASTTKVYRDEQTGELAGLARVRAITQDDAHVFCRKSQIKGEIAAIFGIIETFYKTVGFGALSVRLSLHDPETKEKYLGTPAIWNEAEDALRSLAREKGYAPEEAPGEAAFYGPKIDFIAKDSLGRAWQVATIQLDMNQPERFDLSCVGEDGKPERIFMIHAAIMGSIERFLAPYIEHTAGHFPTWLAPVQAKVVPVGEKFEAYANTVLETLHGGGIRAELSPATESLGKRVRAAELEKIPYVLVVGEKEMHDATIAVRSRKSEKPLTVPLTEFVATTTREISERTL
jgi:threonyl-tRNA synthetase